MAETSLCTACGSILPHEIHAGACPSCGAPFGEKRPTSVGWLGWIPGLVAIVELIAAVILALVTVVLLITFKVPATTGQGLVNIGTRDSTFPKVG